MESKNKTIAAVGVIILVGIVIFLMNSGPDPEPTDPSTREEASTLDLDTEQERAAASFSEPTSTNGSSTSSSEEPQPTSERPPLEGDHILRVVLEGLSEEDAHPATITLTGVDHGRESWPFHFRRTWPGQGLVSEVAIDPFFSHVESQLHLWDLEIHELEVKVTHPRYLIGQGRTPLTTGVKQESGQTLYEIRVPMTPGVAHEYWPELTLHVLDANTRDHLENVELRMVPTAFMGLGQVPGEDTAFTPLAEGLNSPISLMGGREKGASDEWLTGLAIAPRKGQPPEMIELVQREETARGVVVYAWAPGYSWGRVTLDVASDAAREVLLESAGSLAVQLSNVQLDRYAELDTRATLWVDEIEENGYERRAWIANLDETLRDDGLWLGSLKPGEYAVSVRLGQGWSVPPILAREVVTIRAGQRHDLTLDLSDPPPPVATATLAGTISFPAFEGDEEASLQFYFENSGFRRPEVELPLAELRRSGLSRSTWQFLVEDLPVGRHQIQLDPFLVSWMVELPPEGIENLELEVEEFAEVVVETIDAETRELIPLEELYFRSQVKQPGQYHTIWTAAETEQPGRFRFRTVRGRATMWTQNMPEELGYGTGVKHLNLVNGLQTVPLELSPIYEIRFELRSGGEVLSRLDPLWNKLTRGMGRNVRAIDHDGRVLSLGKLEREKIVELSRPGLYEVHFENFADERFQPIPAQEVEVRGGETAEVVVELLPRE